MNHQHSGENRRPTITADEVAKAVEEGRGKQNKAYQNLLLSFLGFIILLVFIRMLDSHYKFPKRTGYKAFPPARKSTSLRSRLGDKELYISNVSEQLARKSSKNEGSWRSLTEERRAEIIDSFEYSSQNEHEFFSRVALIIKGDYGLESFYKRLEKTNKIDDIRDGYYKTEAKTEALLRDWEHNEFQDRNR